MPTGQTVTVVPPPPPLQSRTGRALKWGVAALLIAALGLGSWQLADTLLDRGNQGDSGGTGGTGQTQSTTDDSAQKKEPAPLDIKGAQEYYPDGTAQNADGVSKSYDGDVSTYWRTKSFYDGPEMKVKDGVGIVYDLGAEHEVTSASITLKFAGDHTTLALYATDSKSPKGSVGSMKKIAGTTTSESALQLTVETPVKTRYVLLWITAMPHSSTYEYSDPGYKQGITDVKFTG